MQKSLYQLDPKTGELQPAFVAYFAPKIHNGFDRGGWVAMAQTAMDLFAESDLQGQDFKVLMKLMANLDFENLLVINQTEMAQRLGIAQSNFARSVRKLIDMEALLQGPKIGVSRSYRLNPNFGWKGSGKNHKSALDTHLKLMKGGRDQHTPDLFTGKTDAETQP